MEPNRADLGKDPSHVSGMFDQVAAGYDRTNTAMTFGNDALWRAATTRAVAPKRGERILDLAAGTASSSASLAGSGAQVVAADFSPGCWRKGAVGTATCPISPSCRRMPPISPSATTSSTP
ncbi:hypothetical protein GCM10025863_31800 [Microbacterium suwonense]|uniref:Demethylmenaquinone methyltransferase n=1 Tax=Microbacterium suwonense TaxID=683047 RepID=A0ABM8FXT9_9MICO|nr:hypothetical protein GCM10025863_31800 [Microbacterium suwonense]